MAPKGQKRNAPDAKKIAAAKKTRIEATETVVIEDPAMVAILEAIEHADKLSKNCRKMLIAGVRGSLNTPLDQRHELQTMVVRMVEEVIETRQASLLECFDSATAAEANIESVKVELAKELSQSEGVLAEQIKNVEAMTLVDSAAQEKVASATALLAEKQALQRSGDCVMHEKQQNKATIQHAIEVDLKAILEGKSTCKDLLTLISKLRFDESLIQALPSTCAKAPADRGAFDSMVLNQLETSLKDTLAEFSSAVEAEVLGVEERASAVEAANALVQESMASQAKAAKEQSAAETSRLQAIIAVDVAMAARAAHEGQAPKAAALREGHSAALEDFKNNTRRSFNAMKDANGKAANPDADAAPAEAIIEVTTPHDSDAKVKTCTEAKVSQTIAGPDPLLAPAGGA